MDVGIVGGGGAGLVAAWLLGDVHRVTLYERESRLGGHLDTVTVDLDGERIAVDAGVDFFWPRMWPTFCRLLAALRVPTHRYPVTVTLYTRGRSGSYRMPLVRGTAINWPMLAPRALATMLRFSRLLRRAAPLVLAGDTSTTVEEFVEGLASDREFKDAFVYPLLLAGWGMDLKEFRQIAAYDPLKYLVMREAGGFGRAHLHEVVGGTRTYVDALAGQIARVRVKTSSTVREVTRPAGRYVVRDSSGDTREFDHLILATGACEARELVAKLANADALRRELGRIEYFKTSIAIHSDRRLMPLDRRHWSVINIRHDGAQSLNTVWKPWASRRPVFRSWIAPEAELPEPLFSLATYHHPKVSPEYFEAQRRIAPLQGRDGLWLAGVYLHDVDCHESAIHSAVEVARRIGATPDRLARVAPGPVDASAQVPGTQR
jgi:predicted NAD/FAD-binding protein